MALPGARISEPPPPPQSPVSPSGTQGFLRKLFRRPNGCNNQPDPADLPQDKDLNFESNNPEKSDLTHRMSRKVVPELPRAQTFKRQQSERRDNLTPVEPTPDERRAVSVDRRSQGPRASSPEPVYIDPRTSAPGALGSAQDQYQNYFEPLPVSPVEDYPFGRKLEQLVCKDDEVTLADEYLPQDAVSTVDTQSLTTSQYEAMIHEELEKKWILNLSMHFRDRSRREKFFVTYREDNNLWRRVTVSLDYRNAPSNSLEDDLIHTRYQREKSAKIYEAIRESLPDIQFYDTVTNLKLQTTDGRLHVHVVEDGNEIIHYPLVTQIDHLGCRRIRERDIIFDSHMSGFVYKVNVNGQTMIKKEIPSPDTIEEFMYEVNALSHLVYSRNVIQFYGIVVDDQNEHIKGLLISFAEKGALIDIIYEHCKEHDADIPWKTREKWARQIVEGLSDIHESGFVQGDFTLSNIVIDEHNDAKIIDINRRGCPVGWEPPEATPLIERNQRISMYIGVKSDLYQLGMVLWALAAQEDEPEAQGRPLILGPEVNVPDWYRRVAETCLSNDPRMRLQALSLLQLFPPSTETHEPERFNPPPPSSTDDGYVLQKYLVDGYHPEECPQIRTVEQPSDWSYVSRPYTDASPGYEPYYYTRGRSPPSPITSNYGRYDSAQGMYDIAAWAANRDIPSSYSDVDVDELLPEETPIAEKPILVEPNLTAAALGIVVTEEEDDSIDNLEQEPNPASKVPQDLGVSQKQNNGATDIDAGLADRQPVGEHVEATATNNQETTDDDSQDTPTMQTTNLGTQEPMAETEREEKNESLELEQETTRQERNSSGLPAHSQDPKTTSLSESNTKQDLPTNTTAEARTPAERMEPADLERKDVPIMAGNTVPDPITPAKTDTTLKTVTPPSTCGPADDGTTRTGGGSLDEKRIGEQGVDASKLRVEPVEQHDSLTGIGAAHLTNHDDVMQKKELYDDDFTSAAPPIGRDSPMITTTDAKT